MTGGKLDRLTADELRERLIEADPLAPGGMEQIDAILERLQEVAPISHNTDLVCTYQELVAHFPGGVLPNESKPTTHRHRWKRTTLVAAILLIVMLVGAVAYAAQTLGLFVSIQEKFTQIQTNQGTDALVQTWTDAPVPFYTPSGFFISDATDCDGLRIIEYANSEGDRYMIYLYDANASARIDTENTDDQKQMKIGDTTAYMVEKDGLTTLYWSLSPAIVSIEFCPEDISLVEITAVAESMATPNQEKER